MQRTVVAPLLMFLASSSMADTIGMKPGLWETKILNNVVDGRDMSAVAAGTSTKMQQMMANMPAEQRAKFEAMMKQSGAPSLGANGAVRMCISPEMASRNQIFVDHEGHCQPAQVATSGSHATFEINCASNGTVTTGHGEATRTNDRVLSKVDMTTKNSAGASHVMHVESEMTFLGSDCGDIKPPSVPAKP